jgi:hypothetical protein
MAWVCVGAQEPAVLAAAAVQNAPLTAARLVELRREAAQKPRRIIFNNDGDDALIVPRAWPATPESMLRLRTAGLVGSQVDSIFYCTLQGPMSLHRTKVGETLTANASEDYKDGPLGEYFATRRNIIPELIAQGTDPLQVMVDFCRAHGLEVFCSMRMNDTHDGAHRPDRPYSGFSRFKRDHPECLVGSFEAQPLLGSWTAFDFAQPAVRELVFLRLEEVCQNYDLDGIELDYLRHALLFKSVAWGGQASQAERDMMTDLIRRIRAMTQAEGMKKGKPLLVSIRVPDSLEYCRAVGLDVEKWLAEGLVDMLTVTCYFQLNPWEYSARLGHTYGVPVYAGLSESRVRAGMATGWPQEAQRNSALFYRGYALQAWQSGVDGVYMFNYFDPAAPGWRDLGDPQGLRGLDKVYFMSPRGDGSPGSCVRGGETFRTTSTLSIDRPLGLPANQPQKMTLVMAEDLPGAEQRKLRAEMVCRLWVKDLAAGDRVDVVMNGRLLEKVKASAESLDYRIEPAAVQNGDNVFELTARPAPRSQSSGDPGTADIATWEMEYVCDKVLVYPEQLPWRRLMNYGGVEQVSGRQLLLADRSTGATDMFNLAYPWHISPEALTVVEARVRVLDSTDPLGVCIRVANGAAVEYLSLGKDQIRLYHAKLSCPLDAAGDLHTYRIVMKGNDIRVYVDGTLKLDGAGKLTTAAFDRKGGVEDILDADWNRNSLLFGSATGQGTGEATWEYIKCHSEGKPLSLQDLIVTVTYLAPQGGAKNTAD